MSIFNIESLYPVNKAESKSAAHMLSRAFIDYPLHVAFLSLKDERERKSPLFLEFAVRYGIEYGNVYSTSQNMEAAIILLPSDKADFGLWNLMRSGAIPYFMKLGVKNLRNILSISDYVASIHKQYAPFPHLYILYIGVEPDLQSKGYGKILIKATIESAEHHGLPCYLETQTPENASLWEHFGFRTLNKSVIPNTAVTHWAMLRE